MLIALRDVGRRQKIGPLAHARPISSHASDVARGRNRENFRKANACQDERNDGMPALQRELRLETDGDPPKDGMLRETLHG